MAPIHRYTLLLIPDQEESGYTVTAPALPGCITEGDSLEEAVANAKDAIRLYLEDLIANGEPVWLEGEPPRLAVVEVAV